MQEAYFIYKVNEKLTEPRRKSALEDALLELRMIFDEIDYQRWANPSLYEVLARADVLICTALDSEKSH